MLTALLISFVVTGLIFQMNKQKEYVNNISHYINTIDGVFTDEEKHAITDYNQFANFIGDQWEEYRITFIDKDGNVLGDSEGDISQMDNHKDRYEVVKALRGVEGSDIRTSTTMGEELIYVAQKFTDDVVIRVASPMKSVYSMFFEVIPALIIGLLVAMIISVPVARKMSLSSTEPILRIANTLKRVQSDSDFKVEKLSSYEEVQPLVDIVLTQAESLRQLINEIKDEKEKTKYILNSMEQGLIVVDQEEKVILINKKAVQMFKVSSNTQGQHVNMVCHEKTFMDHFDMMFTSENGVTTDLVVDTFKESTLRCHFSKIVENLQTSEGNVVGGVILITDVSEKIKLENFRKEFIANVSHELKTPITSIKGFSELITSKTIVDHDKIVDFAGFIFKDASRLALLVEDILRLEEVQSATSVRTFTNVNIKNIVSAEIEVLNYKAKQKEVTIDFTPINTFYQCDVKDISFIISNLLGNGIDYNKVGGVVSITLEQDDTQVKIIVSDTGIGIAPKDIERIFERFYRADKGRSRGLGGTGLGLAIVKHTVLQYGGTIDVKSAVGQGTTFTVTLPIAVPNK